MSRERARRLRDEFFGRLGSLTRRLPDPLVEHEMTPDPPRDPDAVETLEEAMEVVINVYRLDRNSPPVARDLRRIARDFAGRGRLPHDDAR